MSARLDLTPEEREELARLLAEPAARTGREDSLDAMLGRWSAFVTTTVVSFAPSRLAAAAPSSSATRASISSSGTRPASNPRTLPVDRSAPFCSITRSARASRSASDADAIRSRLPGE